MLSTGHFTYSQYFVFCWSGARGSCVTIYNFPNVTVEELQQTLVEGLKAGREDGKLTKEEIASLGEALLDSTIAKMSAPTAKLLAAAAVDVTALIQGAGESWIAKLKAGTVTE